MRIGLVGYGVGGRYFHAPFIEAADGCEFVGVVARSPQRVAEVHQDLPGMPVFGSMGETARLRGRRGGDLDAAADPA